MPHFLYLLLLALLSSRADVLVKARKTKIDCGDDTCCLSMAKVVAAVNEINSKLDAQARDLKALKENINENLVSTTAVSRKLERHSADLAQHDDRLKAHNKSSGYVDQLVLSIYGAELGPRDCSDIREMGYYASGIYRIYPGSDTRRAEMDVYCDLSIPTESWLVFQRRKDGSENFYRTWREYERGFGVMDGEFWLGNEKLFLLTTNKRYQLRIELTDFFGETRLEEYTTFSVKSSMDNYRLTVGGASGNAGDSFTYHNNAMFSTKDADNDNNAGHCAQQLPGGWWFSSCLYSNLNGIYLQGSHTRIYQGIYWFSWKGHYYSLKASEMKIAAAK